MFLWRISPFRDLNGEGGRRSSARWHFAGLPVVYLAESPAGALLEICANTAADDAPPVYTLLKISGPEVAITEIALKQLPPNWTKQQEATRPIGANWLTSQSTALLRIPSALVPETANYLLNPLHPDAPQFQIQRTYEYPFDLRLKS
jgi:RES domain-containing protein